MTACFFASFLRQRAPHCERRSGAFGSEEQTAGGNRSGRLSQRAEPPRRQQVSQTA